MNNLNNKSIECEIRSDLSAMQRRTFLARTAQTGLLAGFGFIMACSKPDSMTALPAGEALDNEQMFFFSHLTQVLLPTAGTPLTPSNQVPILSNLDKLMLTMPQSTRTDLAAAIKLFEYGGMVLGWRFSRFTRMPDEDAIQYIDSWQTGHPMQQGIVSVLKRLVYSSYWRDDSTWGPLQFDGPVSEKWGLTSLGEAPLPQR